MSSNLLDPTPNKQKLQKLYNQRMRKTMAKKVTRATQTSKWNKMIRAAIHFSSHSWTSKILRRPNPQSYLIRTQLTTRSLYLTQQLCLHNPRKTQTTKLECKLISNFSGSLSEWFLICQNHHLTIFQEPYNWTVRQNKEWLD